MAESSKLGILFDLDGTLLDTLEAIASSANHALEQLGHTRKPDTWFLPAIGYGVHHLLTRSLGDDDPVRLDQAIGHFRRYYDQRGDGHITIYPGIQEMLDALEGMPVALGVLSNKPHEPTRANIRRFFPGRRFEYVYGQREGVPVKPDAGAVAELLDQSGIPASRWVMVGDSDADMMLARNAGMIGLGVLWGFRDEQVLKDHGATLIARKPAEVAPRIEKMLED
ncbi:MAG: HAD family hydrolase [Phycisphaeraceae bacterium]|nr:HAD family hydrolase [Phycisphaeraceae bacterium]